MKWENGLNQSVSENKSKLVVFNCVSANCEIKQPLCVFQCGSTSNIQHCKKTLVGRKDVVLGNVTTCNLQSN